MNFCYVLKLARCGVNGFFAYLSRLKAGLFAGGLRRSAHDLYSTRKNKNGGTILSGVGDCALPDKHGSASTVFKSIT